MLKETIKLYELVTSGVVDGTLWGKEGPAGFNMINGALNHLLIVPGGMYNSILALGINEEKWNTISAADRDAISKISGEGMAKAVGDDYSHADETGLQP